MMDAAPDLKSPSADLLPAMSCRVHVEVIVEDFTEGLSELEGVMSHGTNGSDGIVPSVHVNSLSYAFPDGSSGLENVVLSLPPGSRTLLIGGNSIPTSSKIPKCAQPDYCASQRSRQDHLTSAPLR